MAEARAQLAAARARISELEAAGALATLAAPEQVASGAVERRARQRLAAHEPHAPNPAPIAPRARVASNNALLAAEPRRRWADNGTRRVSLGTLHAHKLLAYVRDPTNRDARGRLRMDYGVVLDGFVGYINNHATETGARHSDDEQLRHSVLIPHELLETAYEGLPGLHALVDGGLRQLPDNEADGHAIVPLHVHVLEQTSPMVCFSDHQDIEEEGQPRSKWADRRVVFTMVLVLSSGGVTSFCILGQDELFYNDEPGSGVIFKSTLWHRTMRVGVGTWKLAVFYGYLL